MPDDHASLAPLVWLENPRDTVSCAGPGAAKYLQSQLTQDVSTMAVGEQLWSFLLAPTGKVDVLVRVTRTAEESFDIDTDRGFLDVLEARLRRFMIRVDASLSSRAGGPPGGVVGEAERVEARWPRMGAEIVPGETIPAETGLLGVAVSFTKGCYPGQELVERMDARGAVARRRLVTVDVPHGTVTGDVVEDPAVGQVTVTTVVSGRALGWARRGAAESAAG